MFAFYFQNFFPLKPICCSTKTLFCIFPSSGMSLSAGSSPLHSPKITPHTSPAPRRRSHTPNPASFMVPPSASTTANNPVPQTPPSGQVIQKETVGGTTYFYTDTTPAPLTGMVWLPLQRELALVGKLLLTNEKGTLHIGRFIGMGKHTLLF